MNYSNLRDSFRTEQWSTTQEQVRPLSTPRELLLGLKKQILLEPFTYISANPGKEIRTKLIDAFNVWLQVPETDLELIRRIVRMLHNASLL